MTRQFVLARQPMARTFFRRMSATSGPICTARLRDAAKFASRAEALASEAVTKGGNWIFAPVEVK